MTDLPSLFSWKVTTLKQVKHPTAISKDFPFPINPKVPPFLESLGAVDTLRCQTFILIDTFLRKFISVRKTYLGQVPCIYGIYIIYLYLYPKKYVFFPSDLPSEPPVLAIHEATSPVPPFAEPAGHPFHPGRGDHRRPWEVMTVDGWALFLKHVP